MARPVDVQSRLEADDSTIYWENPNTPTSAEDYVFINGRRLVRPYFFEFLAHVKRRWDGKNIVDLFAQEFRQRPMQYYVDAVEIGRIRVYGKKVPKTFVVRDSQPISHFVHRHEPPVLAESVKILEEGPDVLIVCKPPSVPVHACGQYRKNTVIGILQAEHNAGPLFPIHRLDRLVSGLLILAKNAETADSFREEIEGGRVSKEYVAKVIGVFTENEIEVNAAILYDKREGVSRVEAASTSLSGQNGPESAAKGKDACTRFVRLSTDGRNSIVKCLPVTGRTHQIRVHLKHLGHPIANDALYLHGGIAERSREASTADHASARVCSCSATLTRSRFVPDAESEPCMRRLSEDCAAKNRCMSMTCEPLPGPKDNYICTRAPELPLPDEGAGGLRSMPEDKTSQDDQDHGGGGFTFDRMCTHCPGWEPAGYEDDVVGIWLHCVKYSSDKWSYQSPLPAWAM